MQKSLVLELQRDAMESVVSITDLLRKAMVVARKLGVKEFQHWIKLELEGYKSGDSIPEYRVAYGEVGGKDPYHGWQPLIIQDPQMAKMMKSRPLMQAISELANLESTPKTGMLGVPFSTEVEQQLMEMADLPFRPILRIGQSQIHGVVDAVRNIVLDWALKLEENGVLGENMSFSEEEKTKAQSSVQINITNFNGILGDVTESSVSQNFHVIKNDWESLEKLLISAGIAPKEIADLKRAVAQDGVPEKQGILGRRVTAWMESMKTKVEAGAWRIAESSAGALLTKALCAYYGFK